MQDELQRELDWDDRDRIVDEIALIFGVPEGDDFEVEATKKKFLIHSHYDGRHNWALCLDWNYEELDFYKVYGVNITYALVGRDKEMENGDKCFWLCLYFRNEGFNMDVFEAKIKEKSTSHERLEWAKSFVARLKECNMETRYIENMLNTLAF